MGLHEEYDESSIRDHSYQEDLEDLPRKKRVKRMLEDRLELKRLKAEFKGDFDEFNGDFDWDELNR